MSAIFQSLPWPIRKKFLDPPGTIRKQRATIEKLTRENRKMKARPAAIR